MMEGTDLVHFRGQWLLYGGGADRVIGLAACTARTHDGPNVPGICQARDSGKTSALVFGRFVEYHVSRPRGQALRGTPADDSEAMRRHTEVPTWRC